MHSIILQARARHFVLRQSVRLGLAPPAVTGKARHFTRSACRRESLHGACLKDSLKSILVVHKDDVEVAKTAGRIRQHIWDKYPGVRVLQESSTAPPDGVVPWKSGSGSEKVDLVVTLGGDGTILHASSLFRTCAVPPVLSFSMGTLGFLLPFHIDDFAMALESVWEGKYKVLDRMRLGCAFKQVGEVDTLSEELQVMNELALHRGDSSHLTTIDVFVDGQHLTEAVSDGIILSTPTGSTAYSLSAGGPIVHPTTRAILLTPICPRSLSFRPLLFPSTSVITLQLSSASRGRAGAFLDGQQAALLRPGDSIDVRASKYPIPAINRSSIVPHSAAADQTGDSRADASPASARSEDDWVRDINGLLQYNATFRSKAILMHNR